MHINYYYHADVCDVLLFFVKAMWQRNYKRMQWAITNNAIFANIVHRSFSATPLALKVGTIWSAKEI